ncbi:MAG TPA: hypothetical protein VMV77_11930 [Bacteroidales bacterium]|nr:hypothetical protein [Bacteroidales bacterium]
MKKLVIVFLLAVSLSVSAQDNKEDQNFGIVFSGFVKTDILRDTRQSSTANGLREGHFYLFPDNVLLDAAGNDINDNPKFHILNIQTRLKGVISGPDAFGAKTSGGIEAEFFGTSESDINGFRLRHAFVKLDWSNTSLLIGQNWHPMFPVESYPLTLSFNTGAPFTPFSRNPQVRVTRKLGDISLLLTAYAQRDFTSSGPFGSSNSYLRNSGLPGFDLQARIPVGDVITGWAGVDYKKLRPELVTTANFETDATIGSFSAYANVKIKTSPVNLSVMGVYGQNASDLVMIGGYAVSGTNSVSQIKTYTNLNTANFWADMNTNGKKVAFGLFTGFSKNLGASEEITGAVYGRGNNIDHLFRVSPRVTFTEGRLTFAAEIESTTAAYGTMQTSGKVTNTNNVSNLRILLSTIYQF